jgi:hypothetical protein
MPVTPTPPPRNARRIVCPYCAVVNPVERQNCIACGAPLDKTAVVIETSSTVKGVNHKPDKIIASQQQLDKARKAGEKVEAVANTALYTYSLFWRTLAEAGVIAICGFALGLVGGALDVPILGTIEAVLLGIAVGFTIKYSLLIWVMTPGGFVLGAAIGAALWALGVGTPVFAVTTGLCAIILSLLGAYRIPYRIRNFYEKIRPVLGGLGGLLFGLLGMAIGLGLRAGIMVLLTATQ